MPWTPQNDFEEEVVNLQPDHDFIFGYLSEQQYPRPTSHTEYVAARKLQEEQQQKVSNANSAISAKLRVIEQVQRLANTKPVGELPRLDDWDTNENLEQETIGLMRHFGMSASIEQPLTQKATLASFPIENTNKVFRNGRRRVALFLDDNMFKLRERASDTSSGFESCNNSGVGKFQGDKEDSLCSEMEGNTSLNASSSLSFSTAEGCNESFSSATSNINGPKMYKPGFSQYEKLLDDTSLLSLNCTKSSSSSAKETSDSFKTISRTSWVHFTDSDDEDIFNKMDNWPALSKNDTSSDLNSTQSSYLHRTGSSEASNTEPKREDFLDRLLKSVKDDDLKVTASSTPESITPKSPPKPKTYATITKTKKSSAEKKKTTTPDFITSFPSFYKTKKIYALKRMAK